MNAEKILQQLNNKRKDTERLAERVTDKLDRDVLNDEERTAAQGRLDYWEGRLDGLNLAIRLLEQEESRQK